MMSSIEIKRTAGEEIFESLVGDDERRGIPITGMVELTNKCNLNCIHCYIKNAELAGPRHLSTEQWLTLLAEIADAGCLFMAFTGGEILTRPDFWRIYEFVKRKGILVTLFTNATLINNDLASALSDLPPKNIEVTIYGACEQSYESMTRVAGSFRKFMNGIECLVEHGLPLTFKAMATKYNYHELSQMENLAQSFNVSFRYDPEINKRLDGKGKPETLRLSPEEIVDLDIKHPGRAAEFKDLFTTRSPVVEETSAPLFFCGAGTTSFHIDYRGYLSPCVLTRFDQWSVLESGFSRGWYEFIPQIRQEKRTRSTECNSCDVIHACSQCPGWAELENGDKEEPVSFLCSLTKLRKKAFSK